MIYPTMDHAAMGMKMLDSASRTAASMDKKKPSTERKTTVGDVVQGAGSAYTAYDKGKKLLNGLKKPQDPGITQNAHNGNALGSSTPQTSAEGQGVHSGGQQSAHIGDLGNPAVNQQSVIDNPRVISDSQGSAYGPGTEPNTTTSYNQYEVHGAPDAAKTVEAPTPQGGSINGMGQSAGPPESTLLGPPEEQALVTPESNPAPRPSSQPVGQGMMEAGEELSTTGELSESAVVTEEVGSVTEAASVAESGAAVEGGADTALVADGAMGSVEAGTGVAEGAMAAAETGTAVVEGATIAAETAAAAEGVAATAAAAEGVAATAAAAEAAAATAAAAEATTAVATTAAATGPVGWVAGAAIMVGSLLFA